MFPIKTVSTSLKSSVSMPTVVGVEVILILSSFPDPYFNWLTIFLAFKISYDTKLIPISTPYSYFTVFLSKSTGAF